MSRLPPEFPFESHIGAALRSETAAPTDACIDPDDLIGFIERGAGYPGAPALLAHLADCANCCREYGEMRRTLHAAEQALQQQPETPVKRGLSWNVILRQYFALPAFGAGAAALLFFFLFIPSLQRRAERAENLQRQAENQTRELVKNPPTVISVDKGVETAREKGLLIPRLVAMLTHLPGLTRGGSSVPTLKYPVAKVIRENQPTFRWKLPAGMTQATLILTFMNERGKTVSTRQTVTSTTWRPSNPLGRGKVYQWQIIAPPETQLGPSAKFQVLEARQAEAIERMEKSAPLALGVAYAQAGLLDEAKQAFEAIPRTSPAYSDAQKFLRQLQARRKSESKPD